MDDLPAVHFSSEHRHTIGLRFPSVDGNSGASCFDARLLRPIVAKQVLISSQEVVVSRHPILYLAVPPHIVAGEVLAAEHVVAAKFEMRTAESEYHGIGHHHSRRVEVLVVGKVVHVCGKNGAKIRVFAEVLVDDILDVREASFTACQAVAFLISPHLGVQEIHLSRSGNLRDSPLPDSIHDESLLGMSVLHVVDECRKAVAKVEAIAIVVVDRTASTKLVNLITVEIKEGIDLIIAFCQIRKPFFIAGIHQVDIAFPRVRKVVFVFCRVVPILEDEPFRLNASSFPTVEHTIAKVVEDTLHASVVLSFDVVLDGRSIDSSVRNVFVGTPKPAFSSAS